MAKRQSLGFFDDVSSSQWQRMQNKIVDISPTFCERTMTSDRGSTFWQCHYEPDFELEGSEMAENGSVTHIARPKKQQKPEEASVSIVLARLIDTALSWAFKKKFIKTVRFSDPVGSPCL